ncbi:MAG TPA: site-specific DNA-methyltransferase [Polyangiaceae bacterium LLY-WYZ-15_(1-7)]|nr:DNA methylase N-4 [Myxococcales bacterium]MAT25772.1 DNA methylase N-4 [Sandaracinus sp.]HJK91703.1 site-specific DNA-methyltransferase [Polyangiaceae bacterium LLY-WYZ-15_(1-7)]MBJ70746.1 DNA methylase N-4 [Sandaracinus sp.]HJL04356.1 site-specific DNA-methyltransferase [Polyangiaceae bacterium LLY-WYZ-15_(1-7)]
MELHHWLAREDAVAWLEGLPDECAHLAITDPPYESLEKHRSVGTTTRLSMSKSSSNAWFPIFPNARFEALFAELYRVLKPDAHLYLFCDPTTAFVVKPIGEAAGFTFWKPLVWDKRRIGMGYHYRSRYELVLFFEKGKRRLADLSVPDVLEAARVHGGYPTEKPAELIDVLVRQSSSAGELVIDPFFGSGATGEAALGAGRPFWGCDLTDAAHEIATPRLGAFATPWARGDALAEALQAEEQLRLL